MVRVILLPDTDVSETQTIPSFYRLVHIIHEMKQIMPHISLFALTTSESLYTQTLPMEIEWITITKEVSTSLVDMYRLLHSLFSAQQTDMLIIKSSSTTTMSPSMIVDIISKTRTWKKQKTPDITYLCRWLDDCLPKNMDVSIMDGIHHITAYETHQAHGAQALYFSANGFQKLGTFIQQQISFNRMVALMVRKGALAIAVDPNVFVFDISFLNNQSINYMKLFTCAPKGKMMITQPSTSFAGFWFIVVIIFICIGVFMYTKWITKHNKEYVLRLVGR